MLREKWTRKDSNLRSSAYQTDALPELGHSSSTSLAGVALKVGLLQGPVTGIEPASSSLQEKCSTNVS